jgi:hypothetical protein
MTEHDLNCRLEQAEVTNFDCTSCTLGIRFSETISTRRPKHSPWLSDSAFMQHTLASRIQEPANRFLSTALRHFELATERGNSVATTSVPDGSARLP